MCASETVYICVYVYVNQYVVYVCVCMSMFVWTCECGVYGRVYASGRVNARVHAPGPPSTLL